VICSRRRAAAQACAAVVAVLPFAASPGWSAPASGAGGASAVAGEDNGRRAHCNGGGSCCKNHGDSDACPGDGTGTAWCTLFPTVAECLPA
jgi:hypothetical protein